MQVAYSSNDVQVPRVRACAPISLHGTDRAEFEAKRAQGQFDTCEPEHRLVARALEARLEHTLAELERERRKLAELETRHPEPDRHRAAGAHPPDPCSSGRVGGRHDHRPRSQKSCWKR
jgi:hypothetical protein